MCIALCASIGCPMMSPMAKMCGTFAMAKKSLRRKGQAKAPKDPIRVDCLDYGCWQLGQLLEGMGGRSFH